MCVCQDCKVEICLMCYIEDHRSHKVKTHDRGKQAALEISKDSALSCMAKPKENRDGLEKNITELADDGENCIPFQRGKAQN